MCRYLYKNKIYDNIDLLMQDLKWELQVTGMFETFLNEMHEPIIIMGQRYEYSDVAAALSPVYDTEEDNYYTDLMGIIKEEIEDLDEEESYIGMFYNTEVTRLKDEEEVEVLNDGN